MFTYTFMKYTANNNKFKNFLCLSLRSKILLRAGHEGAKKDNGYSQKYCLFWTLQCSNQMDTTNGRAQKVPDARGLSTQSMTHHI